MGKLNRHQLAVVVTLIAILAVVFSWLNANAQENGGRAVTLTPAADAVQFSANFQAEEKPPEVLTRYASTTIGDQTWTTDIAGEGKTTTQRGEFITSAGEALYTSDVCVHGGRSGDGVSCFLEDDIAGAATTNGSYSLFADISLLDLGLDASAMGAMIQDNSLKTQVRCSLGENGEPQAQAIRPAGVLAYGGSNTLGLISGGSTKNIAEIEDGVTWEDSETLSALLGIAGRSTVEVRVTPKWGKLDGANGAFSEVQTSYRVTGRALLNSIDTGWQDLTVRSECGFTMSGEDQVNPMRAPAQSPLRPLQALPEPEITSAPGSPQASGFTSEGTLSNGAMDYHLLATRELGSLDRRVIEEVLAEIAESGEVEGSNWKIFDVGAAGELIPVIEIELEDGAIVQVRPVVEGTVLPSPDLVEVPATTTATTTTPQLPAPTSTREISTSNEATTVEEPTTRESSTASASLEPEPGEDADE